ncbi:hypothetical protein [Bradyrhizobium zhanjiangense]|uniref:Uncharacterized protein n=1 Tax=Bradyrhizobium zhanjiangense TaxID=1325107 RepID=A0ABY0D8K6_9BRAD|nr:hypothetical protein [Bradyrhizobium zhanjiangense]RXG84752.1 hypothetical protein EAS62_39470 [Bradyrhizobium zhanjiangense]
MPRVWRDVKKDGHSFDIRALDLIAGEPLGGLDDLAERLPLACRKCLGVQQELCLQAASFGTTIEALALK